MGGSITATSAAVASRAPVAPGVLVASLGGLGAWGVHHLVSPLSAAVVAVVIGVGLGNSPAAGRLSPGLRMAGRHLVRAGVVVLGLRISAGDVVDLGAALLVVVVSVVGVTFAGTRWFGRRMGLTPGFSLLVATGWSICGASAIAAVEPLADVEEEEVAYAVAMVTLCGSLAIVVLPLLGSLVGLPDATFGAWAGASVHDVGQVIAAASARGDDALAVAVVVKLTRVALLAPLLAVVLVERRRGARAALPGPEARPAPLPAFVLGFTVAVGVRTTGWLPDTALDAARDVETVLVAAGLVGLGGQVAWRRLRRLGGRPSRWGWRAGRWWRRCRSQRCG
ncbi:MAG: putative sulfate exporter family transporter [Acidimicrobiales bacterium]|nr:putative sulfate exporter family transporter [Acidimicrobiales bacterium]